MKNLYNGNSQLKNYVDFQSEILQLEEAEPLSLILITKENGYEDVFALSSTGKLVGELFPKESRELYYFVKYPENFFIRCNVRKFLEKENNFRSVVINISVDAKDTFDYDKFLQEIENAEQIKDSEYNTVKKPTGKVLFQNEEPKKTIKQEWLEPSPAKPAKGNGCFKTVMILILIFFLLIIIFSSF